MLLSIVADLEFALRRFGRTPFTTLTMVGLLALGIGANSALFMVLYSLGRAPAPGMDLDERLVRIRGIDRSRGPVALGREFAYPEYLEYAAQSRLFSSTVAWTSSDVVLRRADQEHPDSGAATYVTRGYFETLGVPLVLGAGLPPDAPDEGPPQLVGVISHAVWDRYFGRARDVLNRTILVNDVPVTIAGVAPPRFAGTRSGGSQMRVWAPLNARLVLQRSDAAVLNSADALLFSIAARLEPGIEAAHTLPTVEAIAARAAQQTPRWQQRSISTDVVTLVADNYYPSSGESPSWPSRAPTLLMPLLILLIPCTNVSGLLVGLAVSRKREIAVRFALGASRLRVVRQLLTESLLLAVAAAGLGLFVIWILVRLLSASMDVMLMNWPLWAFTFGVAVLAAMLFGTSPALHATALSLVDVLKDGGASGGSARSRLQSVLVVGQIALTQPLLLMLAALLLGMLSDLGRLPAPADPDRLAQIDFAPSDGRDAPPAQIRGEMLDRVRQRIAELPGVTAVVPQGFGPRPERVSVHPADRLSGGQAADTFVLSLESAPPGYFELMGFPLVRGRGFEHADENGPAVVIRGDLARRLWGDADPIGKQLVRAGSGGVAAVVVGVVDEAVAGVSREEEYAQVFTPTVTVISSLLVRTKASAQTLLPTMRSIANMEAPLVPVTRATTLAAVEGQRRSSFRLAFGVAAGSSALALLMSAIGLYASVSFAVAQRVREIGIRTALGADQRQVVDLFFRRGLRLSAVGMLAGLALSIAGVRLMSLAQGTSTPDGIGLATLLVALVVVGVAAVATWMPARRAARFDPIAALRE